MLAKHGPIPKEDWSNLGIAGWKGGEFHFDVSSAFAMVDARGEL